MFGIKTVKELLINAALSPISERSCNICGYEGCFKSFGRPRRLDALCRRCGSVERHRLLMWAIETGRLPWFSDADATLLHFAPERSLSKRFSDVYPSYVTADLFAPADLKLDIENIDLDDESFSIVIANHVLEHVDDNKAGRELWRILKTGGVLVCQVPIVEGWADTYENISVRTKKDRWLYFGQGDHVRYYGADFRKRIMGCGFTLTKEVTAVEPEVSKLGLLRGEKVFVFAK